MEELKPDNEDVLWPKRNHCREKTQWLDDEQLGNLETELYMLLFA